MEARRSGAQGISNYCVACLFMVIEDMNIALLAKHDRLESIRQV
jgi:hypothetical protein